jgi:HlyD family secretion protein
LRILEIQRDRAQAAMIHAQNNIEKMSVKSPQGGLAVLTPVFKMSRFGVLQEGDEVRPGSPILLVVNPAAMEVRARANQVDVYQLQQGQPAEVRLDAYPELVFPGKIGRIGAIAAASQYSKQVRQFAAVISIVGSDPKLLPDLSASADVQLETLENVLLLPREAVFFPQGQPMVEVILDGRSVLRPITLGPMSDCEVVIASGLDAGTAVSRYPRLPERGVQASGGEKKQ